MIFIDTSALLAFAVRTDALHSRALAWSKVLNERLVTTDFVLVEFTNHLSSVSRRGLVPPILQWALTDSAVEVVPATREMFSSGMDLHRKRIDKDWSLTDCISFLVMEQKQISRALTFDHHFEQAGFQALLRQDPA